MWLKSFKFNEKPISDIELIVLSLLSDEDYKTPTDLITELDARVPHWKPERGTIYPLLHRLSDQQLIDKQESPLQFKRNISATNFLSSLLSSKGLFQQFEASTSYLESITELMIKVDPFAAEEFIDNFLLQIKNLENRLVDFKGKANSVIDDEGWTEIDIE